MGLTGATPQNQLDALPLRTASAAAAADVVILTGSAVTLYWGPASLLINGTNYTADPLDAGISLFLTPYLAFTGMQSFALLLELTQAAGANDAAVAQSVIPQYRAGVGIPRTGNAIGGTMWSQAASLTPNYGVLAAPYTVPLFFGWSNGMPGAPQLPTTIGTDCRLWVRRSAVPNVNQTYRGHLWASQ